MKLSIKNRSTPALMGFIALLGSGFLWQSSAHAEELPQVVIDTDTMTCSEDFADRLIKEVSLRSSATVHSASPPALNTPWILTLNLVDESYCEVHLQKSDKATTFVIDEDTELLELVSIATRLAWIVDGLAEPEPIVQPEPSEERERERVEAIGRDVGEQVGALAMTIEGSSISPTVATSSDDSPLAQSPDRRAFSVETVGGAMWIPAAGENLMMVRAQLGWKPWTRVKFDLAGRLPIGAAQWESQGTEYSYKSWSVDLTASYSQHFRSHWDFTAGGGLRRTISELSAIETTSRQADPDGEGQGQPGERQGQQSEGPDQANPTSENPPRVIPNDESDSSFHNALTPWSFVLRTGGSYSVTRNLAVGLEATAAISMVDRVFREDQRIIMDMGRFEFDILLGMALRF